MTTEEFSLEFDLLFNNIFSNKAPGLTNYEKSLFLTQAQEALVLDLYSGKLGDSFESSEELTEYLSNLNKEATYTESTKGTYKDSQLFTVDSDIWFKTLERAIIVNDNPNCGETLEVEVVPVTQDKLYKTVNSPFRGSNKRRILRIDIGNNKVELISKYNVQSYIVKYLSKPSPIILEDLPSGLTINGETTKQSCKLKDSIHRAVLNRAVEIARAVWG